MGRIKTIFKYGKRWVEIRQYGYKEGSTVVAVRFSELENWKERRQDKKTEAYWGRIAAERPLSSYEEYQREWNFREIEYNSEPSNNGLDPINPAFAFDKKLTKYLKSKECLIIDGRIAKGTIRYCE